MTISKSSEMFSEGQQYSVPPEGPTPIASAGAATEHILTSVDSRQSAPPSTTFTTSHATQQPDNAEASEQTPDQPKRSTIRLTFILVALFLSEFVAALDMTIVATAVPVIAHELNSATGYSWIGGAYPIAQAIASPIWAKLSDIWGRKLIMLATVALFFASSTICGTATTMSALIAGRALQGVAGGGVQLLGQMVISDLFSMRQRSLVLGIMEGVWAIAGGTGPPLGGVFASLVSWRWCFYINLPITGLAFLLLLLFLDVKHEKTSFKVGIKAIDWIGIFCFLAFTLMVLLGLDFGGDVFPWDSAKVLCLIIVGIGMLGAFIYSEARLARYPLIPLSIFKDRSNVAAFAVGAFHGLAFQPADYYLPLYLQGVKGESPVRSGLLLIPLVVSMATVSVLTGVVIHKTGRFRELIWIGTTLLCIGDGLYIMLDANTSTAKMIGLTILFGLGAGMLFFPPLIAIQSRTQQEDVATATSTFSFCRSMSISISLILGGVVFQNSMDRQSKNLRGAGLPANIVKALSGKEAAANVALADSLSNPAQQAIIRDAFAFAIRNMWIMYTVLGGLAVLSGLFVGKAKLSKEHVETVTGIKAEKVNVADSIEMA